MLILTEGTAYPRLTGVCRLDWNEALIGDFSPDTDFYADGACCIRNGYTGGELKIRFYGMRERGLHPVIGARLGYLPASATHEDGTSNVLVQT